MCNRYSDEIIEEQDSRFKSEAFFLDERNHMGCEKLGAHIEELK